MGRKSKEEILKDIHSEALANFDDIQEAQRDERVQCMEDRRFGSIAGAQWEGKLGEQFKNKPRFEVNKIQLSVIRIYNEYRNNRITVDFEPVDGSKSDAFADTCDDLYRASERASNAEEAYDNAFDEGTMGGMGAWRLRTEYEDEYDVDNDYQKIIIDPIYDADVSVYFDLNAKRQDKSDANYCYVLTSMTKKAFKDEWGVDATSFPNRIDEREFDWAPEDLVFVAEYYKVVEKRIKLLTYKPLVGEEIIINEEDATDEYIEKLEIGGAVLIDEHKVKTRAVHKYILSGNGILEDCGIIAGKHIPIVPFYGKRWYVDSIERSMGHVRLSKDMQRLQNMQVSKLAEISAYSSVEKPIVTPDQIAGHQELWRNDNIEDYPYLLINPTTDKDGNEMPAGPVGYTRSPQVPSALAALIPYTDQSMKDLLGNQEAGEKVMANTSGDAIELVQQRLDMQTFIYMSNMAKSIKRSGEIWLSMAKDIYVEKGRKLKGITKQGTSRQIELMREVTNPDTNRVEVENDFSKANMEIAVNVGPSSSTKRQAIVKELTGMLRLANDPETAQVLTSLIMMNMEGEGIEDVREFFRDKMVRMGVVKPTDEEAERMAQEVTPPTAQEEYLKKSGEKEAALADKARADTAQSIAKTEKLQADTVETLSKIERDDEKLALDVLDKIR